jgi:hypothetical protein
MNSRLWWECGTGNGRSLIWWRQLPPHYLERRGRGKL